MKTLSRWGRVKAGFKMSFGTTDINDPMAWWPTNWGMVKTASGIKISASDALFLSTYFACLRNISEDMGKTPRFLYERVKGGRERAIDHNVYKIVHDRPNPYMTSINFFETLYHYAIAWKAGYAEIVRDGSGAPEYLSLIHPSRVTPQWTQTNPPELVFKVEVNDIGSSKDSLIIPDADMINLHGVGPGTHGYALSILARENIGLSLQLQKFAAKYFANDAANGIALILPGKATPESIERIRALWNLEYAGSEMAHTVKVLMEDIKIHQFTNNLKDSQAIEIQQHMAEVMASWFRCPQHKAGILLRATFSNIESQDREYVNDTLTPWATRGEQEFSAKLLTEEERKTLYVEHDFSAWLRGDALKKSQIQRNAFYMGKATINEMRAKDNEGDIGPLGDLHFIQANMQTLESAVQRPQQTPPGGTGNIDEDREKKKEDAEAIFKPLFEQAIGRVVNKEVKAVLNAAKKKNSDEFIKWVQGFFEGQRDYYIQELSPVATAFGKEFNIDIVDIENLIQIRADSFIEDSQSEILSGFESKDILGICNARQTEGLDNEIEKIITEIMNWRAAA